MAQEVERRLGKAEATGSNPVSSLKKMISMLWKSSFLLIMKVL